MLVAIGFVAVLALAFANGANDNAKPVATLVGAGLAGPRRALLYGTLATLTGSLLAIALGQALVASFSAKGLVGPGIAADPTFILAVTVGAAATVLAATRFGLPISTTHALIGAVVGAGGVLGAVNLAVLGRAFVVPLLASPLVAIAATATIYPIATRIRRALGVTRETCLCVGTEVVAMADGTAAAQWKAALDDGATCRERYTGSVMGISAGSCTTAMHWVSALAVSFARGLQDGAKITGIALVLGLALAPIGVAGAIAIAMALGGLLAARRVEQTMAYRIAPMNDGQGLLGNVLSASIVFGATALGAPVSTTHVTTGSLFGVRLHTKRPAESWIGRILWSWAGTLPLAAAIAAAIAFVG